MEWSLLPYPRVHTLIVAIAIALAAPGLAQPRPGDPPNPDYVIGPADVLEVAVWKNADLTRTVPVRPDGKISLPLINDVQAAGLTPLQLQAFLAQALAKYVQTVDVAVIVREVHSFKVSVIGQVKRPGRFEFTGRATVLDAIAMAEGLTEFADRGSIMVLRQDGSITKQIPVPYDKLTRGTDGGNTRNVFLQPGDIVVVR